MSEANRQQIELWSGALGKRWVAYQEAMDRIWRPISEIALECAGVKAGEHIVDIGCGCGATALELARRVGPSGSVLGIDVSAPMLDRARQRAQESALSNLALVEADASTYPFDGTADLIFSRFGVMFFADPVAAFSNLRRALRPGGRVTFVCFRQREQNAWWRVPMTATWTVVAPESPTPATEPGPFSLADEARIRAILVNSGFADAACEAIDCDVVLGVDPASTAEFMINAGPAARAVGGANDATRVRVHDAIASALSRHVSSEGVSLRAATWIVRAVNPS
ncbi:MAG TPA: class I SAM-dependent methyltransferase [Candidatus Binataceae bacterium]|nr:class I SAM-dependent methyltransferase [Candidatus Binataceae bacterium]